MPETRKVTFTPLHRGRLKCNLCGDVIKGKAGKSHRGSCLLLPQKNAGNQVWTENRREEELLLVKIVRYNSRDISYLAVSYQCPFCGKWISLRHPGGRGKTTCLFCSRQFVLDIRMENRQTALYY